MLQTGYICEKCHETFTGKNAKEKVQEHIFSCIITPFHVEDIQDLKVKIRNDFPKINDIHLEKATQNNDLIHDILFIERKDGSKYSVVYRYISSRMKAANTTENLLKRIERVENLIDTVLEKGRNKNIDIIFLGEAHNTFGEGNGYKFLVKINEHIGKEEVYSLNFPIDIFIGRIESYFIKTLSGINKNGHIKNIDIHHLIQLNNGKKITIKIEDE